jgi:hypothetical protein
VVRTEKERSEAVSKYQSRAVEAEISVLNEKKRARKIPLLMVNWLVQKGWGEVYITSLNSHYPLFQLSTRS